MSKKCVHKGCGKTYEDDDEPCVYHPGPPEFHEGQKGWKCCKPRVLTFDEFLDIPPCTTGKHSTVDDTPAPAKPPPLAEDQAPKRLPTTAHANTALSTPTPAPHLPSTASPAFRPKQPASPAPPEESDSDEPGAEAVAGVTCRRRGCGAMSTGGPRPARPAAVIASSSAAAKPDDEGGADADAAVAAAVAEVGEVEKCVHHPGQPVFHEGSKGWSCCKRRVLEFDEFMRIEGCRTKARHLYVGRAKKKKQPAASAKAGDGQAAASGAGPGADGDEDEDEKVDTVRHDFYQTPTTVIASLFLKKIDPARSRIRFASPTAIELDLRTKDGKRFHPPQDFPLYAAVDTEKSEWKVLGTKVEFTLVKAEVGGSWPVLRADDRLTGEIIQSGRAGTV